MTQREILQALLDGQLVTLPSGDRVQLSGEFLTDEFGFDVEFAALDSFSEEQSQ